MNSINTTTIADYAMKPVNDEDFWRKFSTLYGSEDLQIVKTQDGQIAKIVAAGHSCPIMVLRSNVAQFYTEDHMFRIEFPLIDLKGCHTFALTRFVGKGTPVNSSDEDWEFEDFVRVKK